MLHAFNGIAGAWVEDGEGALAGRVRGAPTLLAAWLSLPPAHARQESRAESAAARHARSPAHLGPAAFRKHIVLGLSGGVACYKAAEFARELVKSGATVQVVMTDAACRFITPATMQALTNRRVFTSQWTSASPTTCRTSTSRAKARMRWWWPWRAPTSSPSSRRGAPTSCSPMCLARPLGANRVPLLLAPAMNREMWAHPLRATPAGARRRHHRARPRRRRPGLRRGR
ncbi:MAG: flavoprotein [Rubrivivax sp.]